MTTQSIIGYEIPNPEGLIEEANCYPIVSTYQLPEKSRIYRIAIHLELNVIVAGGSGMLLIFQFKNGRMKMIQNFSYPKKYVQVLFLHKSNRFLTFIDNYLSFWGLEENQIWKVQEVFTDSKLKFIMDVLVTMKEDQIIACCNKQIYFLRKSQKWQIFQTLVFHKEDDIYTMCLNKENTFLMMAMFSDFRLEIRYENNKKFWIKYQVIQTAYYPTFQACFIGCDFLSAQLDSRNEMLIFKTNKQNMLFEEYQKILIPKGFTTDYFPSFFDYEKQKLICKNGQYINIFNNENNQFTLQHSIALQGKYMYGQVSVNGQYIIVFDEQQSQFIVRQYSEKEMNLYNVQK